VQDPTRGTLELGAEVIGTHVLLQCMSPEMADTVAKVQNYPVMIFRP